MQNSVWGRFLAEFFAASRLEMKRGDKKRLLSVSNGKQAKRTVIIVESRRGSKKNIGRRIMP